MSRQALRPLVVAFMGSALAAGAEAQGVPFVPTTDLAPMGMSGLVVTVTGIEPSEGLVRLALFDGPAGFTGSPILADVLAVEGGEAEWTLRVHPGRYAVAAVHDRDADGELDRNLLGMPTEPYGFSNGARGSFGPPSFERASFEVRETVVRIEVAVR